MGLPDDRPAETRKKTELLHSGDEQVKAPFAEELAGFTAAKKEGYELLAARFSKIEPGVDCQAQSKLPELELLKPREFTKEADDKRAVQEQIAALNKKYKVRITGAGNKAEYESSSEGNINVDLRDPTLKELEIIERVLDKFVHLSKRRSDAEIDFGGLKIGFAAHLESGRIRALGWHDSDSEPPGIYFAPKNDREGRLGLESTALHEFAHQLQKQFWEDRHGNELPPRSFVKFFGYEKVPASQSKMDGGTYRLTDKDGRKWQHESEGVSECDQDDY